MNDFFSCTFLLIRWSGGYLQSAPRLQFNLFMCLQIFHNITDCVDLLKILRRNLYVKLFLKCHYHFK